MKPDHRLSTSHGGKNSHGDETHQNFILCGGVALLLGVVLLAAGLSDPYDGGVLRFIGAVLGGLGSMVLNAGLIGAAVRGRTKTGADSSTTVLGGKTRDR
jgi:hypothetical protein